MVKVFGLSSIKYFGIFLFYLINVSNGENVCADCSLFIDSDCKVEKTGLIGPPNEKNNYRGRKKEDWPHLEKCLSKAYTITRDLNKYLCSLSPELGCQVIANKNAIKKSKDKEEICNQCKRDCKCDGARNAGAVLLLSKGCLIAYILVFVINRFNSK